MENASKALLMAGGILISILVLSLIAYLYVSFGVQTQEFSETVNQRKITEYNSQYSIYDGRKDLSIYDVVSIINTAYSHNLKYKDVDEETYVNEYQVKVFLGGIDKAKINLGATNDIQVFNNMITTLLDNDIGEQITYKCSVLYNEKTGKVKQVNLTKNTI